MTERAFDTATSLAAALRDGSVGSLELLDHYLARVEKFNPRLNALIWTDVEGARERAREADAARAKGESWGPLHGLPMTFKESYDIAGAPTTWGLPEYKDTKAQRHSLAVQRFVDAGAIPFGKTNVPVMLADWQSFNPVYGTTNNPWDLSRTPGGSSGGSAAALAAGLTGLEAGSDIGASIRNPAHYCGVFGHKPTWGICPPRGHALPGVVVPSDISVIGPLARGADDLDLALSIMAGPDEIDGAGWRLELPPPRGESLKDLRIAVMLDHQCAESDGEMLDVLQALVDRLAAEGAKVDDRARPAIDLYRQHEVYVTLLRAATSGRLAPDLFEKHLRDAERLADDKSYYAMMARANTMRHRDWHRWNNERGQMRLAWAEFFRDWDVLLCPVGASAAWPHDQAGDRAQRTIVVNGKKVSTTDQMFWAGIGGVVFLPSTAAPAGLTKSGLPVGIQILAPHLHDRTAIHVARLIERTCGGFVPPPGYGG